jgi:ATP-dependent exoDNAse (exonuclease V) alpha subunit
MVRDLCGSDDLIAVVAGRAGTGKTYALAACHDAWHDAGIPVLGVAVARRAARELEQGAGIPATSVAALLHRLDARRPLPDHAVVVVDEAGMLGTRDLARLLCHVQAARGGLVLVGDPHQLPAIDAGGAFTALARNPRTIELTENRRQLEPWERTAVDQLRTGDIQAALAAYHTHDRIHTSPTPREAIDRVVRAWAASPGDAIMIAATRRDVTLLNHHARELLRSRGRLGEHELIVAGAGFADGDRILIRHNDSRLGVCNGDRATVTHVDRIRRELHVQTGDRHLLLDEAFLRRSGREPPIEHGYVLTCHIAQGVTVDHAHILATTTLCHEWGYTALTRGRASNHLYLAETTPAERDEYAPRDARAHVDPLTRLADALARSDSQPLALDHTHDARALRRDRAQDRGHGLGL